MKNKENNIKNLLEKPDKKECDYDFLGSMLCDTNTTLEPKVWCDYIISYSDCLAKDKSVDAATKFLHESFCAFDKTHPRRFLLKLTVIFRLAKSCYNSGDIISLKECVQDFLYNSLAVQEANKVNTKMGFYSFRSFSEYSLNDIANETISVAHPRMFNDPLDTLLEWWLSCNISKGEENFEKEFSILLRKACEHIKLRCLIGDAADGNKNNVEDLPVLMWSHYADSHRGFCVRYEFPDDMFVGFSTSRERILKFIHPVKYSDIKMSLSTVPSMEDGVFTKSQEWQYENEMRLLYLNLKNDDDGKKDYPTIPCKGAIKEIYLGVKCSDSDQQRMEKAVRNLDVRLYRMQIDNENPTKLIKLRIG